MEIPLYPALFNSLRTHAEKSFETLPPPKASNRRTGQAAMTSSGMVTSYYNRNNGCFAGTCIVTMGDGSVKQVQDVRKGDKVSVGGMGDSESGTIVCVLKTKINQDGIEMVELPGGLIVTPYHPIQEFTIGRGVSNIWDSIRSFLHREGTRESCKNRHSHSRPLGRPLH